MDLAAQPTQVMSTKGAKPIAALERFRVMFESDPQSRQEWRAQAKVAAILGSCPRTLNSLKSGITNWAEFGAITHGEAQSIGISERMTSNVRTRALGRMLAGSIQGAATGGGNGR